jgi:peptidoglycan/xylan/chitin deacetylase (PgdA/CDA1 family)
MKTMDAERQDPIDEQIIHKSKKRKLLWNVLLIVTTVLLILCVATAMLLYTYQNGLQLQLVGEEQLTCEYQGTFTDPGATASFDGIFYSDKTVPVKISGTVNTQKLGTYKLTYSSEYGLDLWLFTLTCKVSQSRSVVVVDTQAPTIQLITNPDYFTLPGGTYEEEGFTAADNHDGDITDKVERTQTQDQVIYRVADSSGNVAEVTRTIEYSDPIAPELTLKGAQLMMVRLGKTYTEPGFTAQDNCDGDISEKVTVSGTVDGSKAGTYVLEYSVQDNSGNITTTTRTVIVDYVKQVSGLPAMPDQTPTEPNGHTVYLTFDDGPTYYTNHLLDVLDKYGVKVTFFVVYADNADQLKRMDEAGHTVGMHSNTHKYSYIYSSEEKYFEDLYAVQNKIEAAIGYKPMLLRFPGGSSNTVSRQYCRGIMTTLTQKVKELGFRYFDWNGDSGDVSRAKTQAQVYSNVTHSMYYMKNCIMLQHDIVGFSVAAVEDIVKWGLINGYTFAPLTMDSPVCEFEVAN